MDAETISRLNEVLRGNFTAVLKDSFSKGFPRKPEVLLSSTFTDTHSERNVILADPHEIEVSFVDMRYGVRDESTH